MSPIRDVRDIDVPMLIIHSEDDLRCPIVQAEELFVALRLLGKDVDVLPLPRREPRAVALAARRCTAGCAAEIILDWFTEKLAPRRRC